MTDARMRRLIEMAAMVQDAKSAALQKTRATCATLEGQRNALDRGAPDPADLPAVRAALAYEGWAALRRAEIDARLALHRARAEAQLAEARRAFGRRQVLDRIAKGEGPR